MTKARRYLIAFAVLWSVISCSIPRPARIAGGDDLNRFDYIGYFIKMQARTVGKNGPELTKDGPMQWLTSGG